MVIIPIYLFLYLYIIFFDLLPIKENNHNILFGFNLFIVSVAFFIVVLVGLKLKIPNPSNLIENIVNVFAP